LSKLAVQLTHIVDAHHNEKSEREKSNIVALLILSIVIAINKSLRGGFKLKKVIL
jgi:hypothetical protein